jgi:hypothetical protein
VNDTTWLTIVGTWRPGHLELYVDGFSRGSSTATATITSALFGFYRWGWGFSTSQDFNGDVALIACFASSWTPPWCGAGTPIRSASCALERGVLSLDDHDAASHEAMGHVYQHQQKFEPAEMHINRAISLNPNEPVHRCRPRHLPLGLRLLDVGRLQRRHRARRVLRLILDSRHIVRRWHADPFGFLRPWNELPAPEGPVR